MFNNEEKGPSKEVRKRGEQAVALWDAEGTESGFEETSSADFAIPFMSILQKGSPEVDVDDGKYIDGAEVGFFFNPATGMLAETVQVIPCLYHRAMVEWKPDRGGFVAQHPVGIEEGLDRDDKGRFITEDGNEIMDTRYFFCLLLRGEDEPEPVVISLVSTQIKKAKNWLSLSQSQKVTRGDGTRMRLPLYANVYTLSSIPESNADYKWKGYKIELDSDSSPITDAALATLAKDAREFFKESATNIKPQEDSGTAEDEDEIPFD